MKRWILVGLMGVVSLILLGVVIVGILLVTVNPNDYKDDLSAMAYKATGRHVVFEGDISLTVFPWLGLRTGKVTISDLPEFGAEPMLSVDAVAFRVALMPLFSKEIDVKEIFLENASIKLTENSDGKKNWEIGTQAGQEGTDPGVQRLDDPTPRKDANKPMKFQVQKVECKNVQATYRNLSAGASYRLKIDALESAEVRFGGDIPVKLSGSLEDLGSGAAAEVSYAGTINITESGAISGKIAPFELVLQKDGNSLKAALETSFAFAGNILSLNDIKAKAADASLSGNLQIALPKDASSGLGVKGKLDLSPLRVDTLMNSVTAVLPAGKSPSGTAGEGTPAADGSSGGSRTGAQAVPKKGDAGLPPMLKALDADISIASPSVAIGKITLTAVQAQVKANKGKTTVPYSFTLFSGAVLGAAGADFSLAAPAVSLKNEVTNLSVAEAAAVFIGNSQVSGSLQSSLDVTGKGLSREQVLSTLNGKGNVLVAGGEVKGFTLLSRLFGELRKLPGLPGVPDSAKLTVLSKLPEIPENFSYERVSSSAVISKGLVTTNDITLLASALKMNGGGTVNLVNEQLALVLEFLVAGAPPAIPLNISGAMRSPNYALDVGALVKKLVAGILSSPEEAGKILQKAPEAAGDVLRDIGDMFKK